MNRTRTSLALAAIALAACNTDRTTGPIAAPADNTSASLNRGGDNDDNFNNDGRPGFVFTLSNQTSGNAVLKFRRAADGSLSAAGSTPTGGNGSGAGLGSQNALAFSRDGDLLFAVNAGSNTITSFRVQGENLTLVSIVNSGGIHPISLTAARGLLYVLNDGGTGNISGFRYNDNGRLSPIANSTRALSSSASGPAEIQFAPASDRVIVTEKNTNTIGSYYITLLGFPTDGQFTASKGTTPFGFAFRDNVLVVSEAQGGAPDASTASSYFVGLFGSPVAISAAVGTTETSACWVVVTDNGDFAYTANTGSGTISGFRVSRFGSLSTIDANGETAVLGAGTAPADMALSSTNRYLYARNGGNRTISAVRVHSNGSLTVLSGGITGLPAGTVGLVAR